MPGPAKFLQLGFHKSFFTAEFLDSAILFRLDGRVCPGWLGDEQF